MARISRQDFFPSAGLLGEGGAAQAEPAAGRLASFFDRARPSHFGRKNSEVSGPRWGTVPHRIALGSEFLRQGEGLHPDGAGFTLELGFSREAPCAAPTSPHNLTKGLPVCVTGARGSPRLSRVDGELIAILLSHKDGLAATSPIRISTCVPGVRMRIMRSRQPALPAPPHPLMRVAAATSASPRRPGCTRLYFPHGIRFAC